MNAFSILLSEGDHRALRSAWSVVSPHLPQPSSDEEAEVIMHIARTQARSVRIRLRAWSHRWLLERALPSGLPDRLRARAERLYPSTVEGVGIACLSSSRLLKPVVSLVQRSMEDEVMDIYSHSRSPDPAFVRARLGEARIKTVNQLLGIKT